MTVTHDWNDFQANLKPLLSHPETFPEGIDLCLRMHTLVHESPKKDDSPSYEDELWEGISDETCKIVSAKETSIVWNEWHTTRIEDLIAGIVISGEGQILDDAWLDRMGVRVRDVGNSMGHDQIADFGRAIDIKALRKYRAAVGKRTATIIKGLSSKRMKEKCDRFRIERIRAEGGVLETESSVWLLDFWSRKTILGLLLMPLTRHQVMHLNDSLRIKARYGAKA